MLNKPHPKPRPVCTNCRGDIRKSVFFLLLRLYAVFLFSACHGVDSRENTAQTVRTNAFRSLRLGQTESPNSPVATTAASNNGEAIIILNRAPGLNTVEHVLYLSSASEVARISFNDGKLPSSAQAGDVTLNFSNFTPRSVDVQVVSPDATPVTVTIPLDDVIGKFITQLPESTGRTGRAAPASLQREAESDEVLRALYSRALIAVRLFSIIEGGFQRLRRNVSTNIYREDTTYHNQNEYGILSKEMSNTMK